jgi:hypothetical protein
VDIGKYAINVDMINNTKDMGMQQKGSVGNGHRRLY